LRSTVLSLLLSVAVPLAAGVLDIAAQGVEEPTSSSLSLPAPSAASTPASVVLMWPKGSPGAIGNEVADQPHLDVFPGNAINTSQRTGVLILPGGAYVTLASDHEGIQVARWLNDRGAAAFVLTYRLSPRYHYPAQLQDATRAIRWIRSHASDYNLDSKRIGVWGFSAGGHLASLLGTHFDGGDLRSEDTIERVSSRPDFMVLAYPVIEPLGHAAKFSYESLLGRSPDPEALAEARTDVRVTSETPPTFLFHTDSDDAVLSVNSALFYLALKKAGVQAELHIYQNGPHGVGLAQLDPVLRNWPVRLEDWMRLKGFLKGNVQHP
jgi:acetyl esterase/lipase